MQTLTGLDLLARDGFQALKGKAIGVLCNQASVSRDLDHILDLLRKDHASGHLKVQAVFGPEHGLYGHTQDNMIEWEGKADPRTGFVIHSLYGQHREPTKEMLKGVEVLLVDIPDVGARYYTFIWTMALCMKACETLGIPVLVLDRPNPIGGLAVEGTMLDPAFDSFVGLYPLPTRHGLTVGEVAKHLHRQFFPKLKLEVVAMEGWNRSLFYDETGQPWAMPSPNMPSLETAIVYPGGCLLEATNISEGRGTTRPFEIFGAPFIDGWKLSEALNEHGLPGVKFRPIQFEPTFNKHTKTLCEGAFIHVLDREAFEPVLTFVAILQEIRRQCGDKLEWRAGPYEYEYEKRPIDILAGNDWLAADIDNLRPLPQIRQRFLQECKAFEAARKGVLLYAG